MQLNALLGGRTGVGGVVAVFASGVGSLDPAVGVLGTCLAVVVSLVVAIVLVAVFEVDARVNVASELPGPWLTRVLKTFRTL